MYAKSIAFSIDGLSKLTSYLQNICATVGDYETIESVNEELFQRLHELVETPFFRYFKVRHVYFCLFNTDPSG